MDDKAEQGAVVENKRHQRPGMSKDKIAARLAVSAFVATGIGLPIKAQLDQALQPIAPPIPVTTEKPPLSASQEVFLPVNFPQINKIVALTLGSPERLQAEEEFFLETERALQKPNLSTLNRLQLINSGFLVFTDNRFKARFYDHHYKLRQSGYGELEGIGMKVLTQEQIDWASTKGLHPESYGVNQDAFYRALAILHQKVKEEGKKEFFDWFRPDLMDKYMKGELSATKLQDLTPAHFLPDPWQAAELQRTEQRYRPQEDLKGSGFTIKGQTFQLLFPNLDYPVNSGSKAALDQLDGQFKNHGIYLEKLAKFLEEKTGFKMDPKNEVGSAKVPGHESGGAVGPQFMPGVAHSLTVWIYEKFGLVLNYKNPEDAALMVQIYLAMGDKVLDAAGNRGVRFGMVQGHFLIQRDGKELDLFEAINRAALQKWYGAHGPIEQVLKATPTPRKQTP